MKLDELLTLLSTMAKTEDRDVCLGILVHSDGSGRTTSGTNAKDPDRIKPCPFGASKLEWANPTEGAGKLEQELFYKLQAMQGSPAS